MLSHHMAEDIIERATSGSSRRTCRPKLRAPPLHYVRIMSSDFSDKVIGNVYTKVENESLWDIRKSWAQLFYGLHTFEAGEALGLNVSRPAEGQPGGWGWSAAKISVDGWDLWSDKDVIEWWPRVDHDYIHSGAISYLCRDAQSSLVILPAYTTISKSQLARLSSSVSCVIVRDTYMW